MRVFVLGSGSSGNALLVESCGTRVLVEAGVGSRVLAGRLAELGVDLLHGRGRGHRGLDGIVVSHQHGDHFGQADKLARAFGAPLYLHHGIAAPVGRVGRLGRVGRRKAVSLDASFEIDDAASASQSVPGVPSSTASPSSMPRSSNPAPLTVHRYEIGQPLRIGALTITTAQVPHDAVQVAFRIDDGSRALGVATDVGRVTPALVALLGECDAALVEANHCSEMLAFSDYPDVVKRRVSGGLGHLSNAQTADLAARLVGSRLARIWLGHLSRSNNTPSRALEVVATRARRIDVDVLPGSAPVALDVWSTRSYQLGLPFSS